MFLKYITFFMRSFRKDKTFVSINLFGMIAGILVALLAGFYTFYQLSYDKFFNNYKNIYRLEYVITYQGATHHQVTSSASLANILKNEVPGIKDVTVALKGMTIKLFSEDTPIVFDKWMIASPNILDFYSVEFVQGTKESVLENPKSMVLTKTMADRFFPNNDALGKELSFSTQNETRFIITGIIKDIPSNTHVPIEAFAPNGKDWNQFNAESDYKPDNLVSGYRYVYLTLEKNIEIQQVIDQFSWIKEKYLSNYLESNDIDLELKATNISKTHFKQNILYDLPVQNLNSIYYFLFIALIVIIISIINYVNLSLARHSKRNVDIGIRRTVGATKSNIFWQYLSESGLFVLISSLIAIVIFLIIILDFTNFMGIDLEGAVFSHSGLFLLIPFFLLIAFFTGFYPAMVIAGKNPMKILYNREKSSKYFGKRIFILVQIVLSITMFIGTVVIFLQMKFIEQKDKGYDVENVIAYEFYNYGSQTATNETVFELLKESAYINDVAYSTKLPGHDIPAGIVNVDLPAGATKISSGIFHIGPNYLPFMNIDLVRGRNFDIKIKSDSSKAIVNEAFVKMMNSDDDILNRRIQTKADQDYYNVLDVEIIGVVRDFHMQTMHQKIAPLIMLSLPSGPNFYHIKYNKGNIKAVTEHAQKVFDKLESPLGWTKHFPEEALIQQYESEQNLSQMTIWLALLSIILAILGVFGLTAFVVRNSMKMLSLRKIFGADRGNLFKILFKEYALVLIISNMIALPLAWYISKIWLQRFVYRIPLYSWVFVSGALMSILIVFIAINYHVLKVHKSNPTDYLIDE